MTYITKDELSQIPSEYAPKDYLMDPTTDELVAGDELEDGMIVLFEDTVLRPDPQRGISSPYDAVALKERARWCKITRLRRLENSQVISFVGLYADGVKMSRTFNESWYWIVKKYSTTDSQ
jgi:hypothetical protein